MKTRAGLTAALALGLNAAANPTSPSCCEELVTSLPPTQILLATTNNQTLSQQYESLVTSRWSDTAVLHPSCVVTPSSAEEVSAALKIISRKRCKFAVKSGGHNANRGANSIDGGVSIDLKLLKSTVLAQDRSYVSLGSGVTWGEAYNAFNNSNIGFPGGICEDVGVGGVSIGGGESLFLPKVGWVVDNILNYEVVLASGEIVNANLTSHPDLFKSLKGGNTNFGIVTNVKIRAFDFAGLWAGDIDVAMEGPQATRAQVISNMSQATVDFNANYHNDKNTAMQVITLYPRGGGPQIVNTAFANTLAIPNPPALSAFLSMPNTAQKSVGNIKIADWVHQISQFQSSGFREVTSSLTIFNDVETLKEIWTKTDDMYNSLSFKNDIDWMVSFIPQPKIQQSYSEAAGGNSLGLANIQRDQIVIWFTPRWNDPNLDEQMNETRENFIRLTTSIAKTRKAYHPFLYLNFAASSQQPLCGYGPESVKFLRQTAKKYDPQGVFQTLMPGGFKLSRAAC